MAKVRNNRGSRSPVPVAVIHGNKSQSARQKALAAFRAKKVGVLVATDVAARGRAKLSKISDELLALMCVCVKDSGDSTSASGGLSCASVGVLRRRTISRAGVKSTRCNCGW